jgi:AcrR family transcriptional regulator
MKGGSRLSGGGGEGGSPARDRVFNIAADLFYHKGIRAVGVEEIVREAGVAKISLYRSFQSKDELIVAYLERNNSAYWRQLDELLAPHQGDPRAWLDALMEHLAERTTQPGYRGCPYINYCGEFADRSHPGHRVAQANKREWRRRLLRAARALGAGEPKRLADGLMLLVEGAYAISQTLGGRAGPGKTIVWAARALIDAELAGLPG